MSAQEEVEKVLEIANQYTCQHLFSLQKNISRCLIFDILPSPGGYFIIRYPLTYPVKKPFWSIIFGNKDYRTRTINDKNYPIKCESITEAFIICVFEVVKRLELEIPPEIIEMNPTFYGNLNDLMQ
nr:hypothetical transcript [Hymenolepis microstoma]